MKRTYLCVISVIVTLAIIIVFCIVKSHRLFLSKLQLTPNHTYNIFNSTNIQNHGNNEIKF